VSTSSALDAALFFFALVALAVGMLVRLVLTVRKRQW
jgi:hypothetical protein